MGTEPQDGDLIVRKLDAVKEKALVQWIDNKLTHLQPDSPCEMEDIGYRQVCFDAFIQSLKQQYQDVIVIPVNLALLPMALNLKCSLSRFNRNGQILYWSMDSYVHEYFLKRNVSSLYMGNASWDTTEVRWHMGHFVSMMHSKVWVWKRLLDAGLSFWSLDADVVVLKDFAPTEGVDLMLAVDDPYFVDLQRTREIPTLGWGMSYLKNTPATRQLVDKMLQELNRNATADDQEIINRLVRSDRPAHFVNTGIPSPESSQLRVQLLDQRQYINGHIFWARTFLMPPQNDYTMFHFNAVENRIAAMKERSMWLLSMNYACQSADDIPLFRHIVY